MGRYLRLKDQFIHRQRQEPGQEEKAGCRVFAVTHAEMIRVGCTSLVLGLSLQSVILLASVLTGKVGRSNACLSYHAVSTPSRQNENQMPFPEGLSESCGPRGGGPVTGQCARY